jgi:adenine/guanine/hypoxanthine permease
VIVSPAVAMKPFVKGDWEGFFSAFVNNLVQFIILVALSQTVLGFSSELVYGTMLPGVAISFVVGNLFYAWQALELAKREGRDDVCALPYGINTPSLIAYVFLVMLPARQLALAQGASDPERTAWQAGLVACFASGLIEIATAFFAARLRRVTPRAAMLATLSGIGLGFLALGFVLQAFARPLVGITTMAVVFLVYFGRVRFPGRVPGSLVVLAVGGALSWLIGIAPVGTNPTGPLGLYYPHLVVGEIWRGIASGQLLPYVSIIVPMGLLSGISSLQNIESAAAAGDSYSVRPSLVANGLGTIAAALFGSPFPTSIYIGHPAWKAVGARAGYSTLNAIFVTVMCLTGTFAFVGWALPADAGLAIIVWIGIVITAQAYEVTPRAHMPAIAVGMIPGVVAWAALTVKTALRSVGFGGGGGLVFSSSIVANARGNNLFLDGGFALEQGFIYSAMILAAMTVYIIERKFPRAAAWSFAAAGLSLLGLMHSWRFTPGDTVVSLPLLDLFSGGGTGGTSLRELVPAWEYALAYGLVGVLLYSARWLGSSSSEERE